MYLYLDERGAKNFKDWRNRIKKSGEDYFFIGGIFVKNEDEKRKIIEFVREFKYLLHPDKSLDAWELKGSKDPYFKDIDFAKHKWLLWSRKLQKINLNYVFYGVFTKLSYFFYNKMLFSECKIIEITLKELISQP